MLPNIPDVDSVLQVFKKSFGDIIPEHHAMVVICIVLHYVVSLTF